tara:strand:+ start:546 stop:767 length:222 start_codon:yes stop_codon:yes gene_type:complete
MTLEQIKSEAFCLYYEAVDLGEAGRNYDNFADAFESMIDNLFDTFEHADAYAIACRARDIRDENGRGEQWSRP